MQLQVEKLFCYCLVGVEVTRGADTVALREQVDILYIIMIVMIVYSGCKTQTQGSDFVRWCL